MPWPTPPRSVWIERCSCPSLARAGTKNPEAGEADMPKMMKRSVLGVLAALSLASLAAYAQTQPKPQSGTVAGRFTVEHPTLENLGFEWAITGDANRNASVSVEFRRAGE